MQQRIGPLDGIRVLDFTNFLAGPLCTRILSDLGADVVKIEPPSGDQARQMMPMVDGRSAHHMHLYAGKRSVVLDLKSSEGVDTARRLARQCDVVVENWRPGVSHRLGLDYESLSKEHAELVYCSISGYGQSGPGRAKPAYAPIVEALSGYSWAQKQFDNSDAPPVCGLMLGDSFGAIWGFAAIQTALLHRERTGLGSHVDVSLLDAMMFASPSECEQANLGDFQRRVHMPMRTSDGFVIVAPTSEKNFQDLAVAIDCPQWLKDPRFNPLRTRLKNWLELCAEIEAWTSRHTTAQCEEILERAGVPCGRYQSYRDAMRDPQVLARGNFTTFDWQGAEYWMPNVPFRSDTMNTHVRAQVAELGEHTEAVISELK